MKNNFKNSGVFFVFILAVIGIITFGVIYIFGHSGVEEYSFNKDGYALYVSGANDYKTSSYSFLSGSTYTFKNSNNKISFDSVEDGNVDIDSSTVVHYTDNSLLVLKKVVGLDLSNIDDQIILYYNIYKNTEIAFENSGYKITSSTGEKINFSNMLIRINDNKYLFVSDNVRATIGKEEVIDFGNYAYIEYTDGEIIHIYNNTKSHKSIASDAAVVSGDITINMRDKTISKEGKKYITLSNLVINGDSNIDLIPQETTKLPNVSKPNVDTNISGGGVDVENNGSVDSPDNNVDEEVVEEDKAAKQPVYKIVNLVVSPIKVDSEIQITDEDNLITSATEISVVNNSTLEVVYESSVPAGDSSAFISSANLLPDTEYTIYAKAEYEIEGNKYERTFVNKIFRTEAIGVEFKKSYATSNSIIIGLNKEVYSDVTSVNISIYDKDGGRIEYQTVDFTEDSKKEVKFEGLTNNTEYRIVMSNVQCDGITVEDGYDEELVVHTLKQAPVVGDLTYEINKRTSTFELSIGKVVDNDYGIKNYRYEIFRVDQDMSKDSPILTFDSKDLKTIQVNVDENNLNRGSAYTYRVIVEFYDNEKTIEYVKELGSSMQLDGVEYPTVRFEETYVTWEQINGSIIIDDKYDTIVGDDYRVVYKNSVEEYKTYTITSSTSEETIPIAINDLRANESYTFQVYADVNLKDGNKTIDEAYIGTVIVHTKEPQHLQATYSANNDYSNAFSINMKLSDLINQDAKLEASTISGMTLSLYQGSNATGQPEIWKKVVDLDDSAYNSTIKTEFYDSQKLLNPAYFDCLNGDFSQKTYTLKISNVYDYTKFKNEIIIENDTFTFNINSYVPDVPSDSDDAIRVTKIINKTADGFGLAYDDNLQPTTVVGYNVVATYPNDALNAMNLIYHVWVYNPSTNKYEILPELDRILPYDEEGNVDNAIYTVDYGTLSSVIDTDNTLRRGNKYYFTYEVELDLDGDGVKEPVNYPAIHGEDIVLKSPDIEIPKEEPMYQIYPSSSTSTGATWKYKVTDVDNALETSKLYSFVGNNSNAASSANITVNSDDFGTVTFSNLKSNDFYSIKSHIRLLKYNLPTYESLTSLYLHPVVNSLGLKYEAEVSSNTLIVRLLNIEDNEDKINKISSVDITITPPVGSGLDAITIPNMTLNNGVAYINLINYPNYMGQELTIGMKAYFDSGNTGFDVASNFKAIQTLGMDANGNYFSIISNKFEQVGSVVGSEFNATFDPVAMLINATNRANSSLTMNVKLDERGVYYDGNPISFKELKEETFTSTDNVVSFSMLVPSISLVNPSTNKLNITSLLTSALFNPKIQLVDGVNLENNLIYVELHETDENGLNAVKISELTFTPENLANFEITDLTPQKNYMVKFYTKIEVSKNIYEKFYLYDEDSKSMGQEYNFHTLNNVGIDNIQTAFVINSYQDKKILINYTLENIVGYKYIKYNLYEYNQGEFELMDIEIPNSVFFDYDMSINPAIDARPGNEYGFSYGKTYKIEIIPIGVYTLNGKEVEIDLGSKQHVFTLSSSEEAQINITSSKNANNIIFRVNIKDKTKIISESKYSVKLKRVSDNETIYERSQISVSDMTERFTFSKDEYDLKEGESYMLIVYYYGDFNNSGENLTYKEKTRAERFGAYLSLGAISATANPSDSNSIHIVFADSYMIDTIKRISYTVTSTTVDYFSANQTSFSLTGNSDTGIYIYNLKVDRHDNFRPGNVYIITMDFFDANNRLLASEEVSYYYAATAGGGE